MNKPECLCECCALCDTCTKTIGIMFGCCTYGFVRKKLDKNTKHEIEKGAILRDSAGDYTVLNVIRNGNSIALTLRCPNAQTLYAFPVSKLYGMEIVKL